MPFKFDEGDARSLEQSYRTPEIALQRQRTLNALRLRPGEKAADMGCGPGFLVEEIARAVGPKGHAVGIDNSPQMLSMTRSRNEVLPQASVVEATLQQLPFDDDTFDALACIQLLLFIADIPQGLREMHRILKPDGRIAIIETDWRGVVLNAMDDSLTKRMFAAWDDAAASPNLPVRLKPELEASGFKDIGVEGIPILNTAFGIENFSSGMLRGVARQAHQMDAVTEDEAKGWIADMQTKDAGGAYFFCVNRFLFSACKNGGD